MTAVEWLGYEITDRITRRNPHDTIIIQTQGGILIELIEQAKAMEKEALLIIRKFINEFDEQGEVSWNTRDEAENFLNNKNNEDNTLD